MKKIRTLILSSFLLFNVILLHAQSPDTSAVTAKDTAWKAGGLFTATLTQSAFNNWSSGGDDAYSLNSRINLFGNYELGKLLWENNLDMAFGFTNTKSTGYRKNDDFFDFTSKIGYKASKKWYYSGILNIKSQFTYGIDYAKEPFDTISDFLSPINTNLALGMGYRPGKTFSAFVSLVNLKLIYVNDTTFSTHYNIEAGENMRTEFGFIAKLKYEKNIIENIDLMSKLDIFYDYLDPKIVLQDGKERMKAPYFSWEVLINIKVYKVFSVNFNTHLIYDENYRVADENDELKNPKVQFKEVFGIGLAYKF